MPASSAAFVHRARRFLYLTHRWIGIVSCLFFAMWFGSGLVMMYVPFPVLTAEERSARLDPIDWSRVGAGPAQALRAAGLDAFPRSMALEMIGAAPVWRMRTWDGDELTMSAETTRPAARVSAGQAGAIASRFGRAGVTAVTLLERDQWTVAGSFDRWRPLYRVDLDDAAGTQLYVASTNGAVVLDTVQRERFWNWLGAVPHWLYPTVLRKDQPLWRQVVLWTSGICIVSAVTGMWIGILRVRVRRQYKGGRVTPYRGWQWWHHVFGLIGGTLLTTWIVSGWLSVDPGRWFASPGLSDAARIAYAKPGPLPPFDAAVLGCRAAAAKRMRVTWVAGRPLLILELADASPLVLDARTVQAPPPDRDTIGQAARNIVPGATGATVTTITAPDAYWYEAKETVELPVLRIAFDDPQRTWVYLSPATGEIVGDNDARRRTYRWVYDGLHRWDFAPLLANRPLWDVWMWLWSLAGIVVSASGVVIGWRRLTGRRASMRATPR